MIKIYLSALGRSVVNFFRAGDLARVIVASLFLLILAFLSTISFFLGKSFQEYMQVFSSLSSVFLQFTLLSLVSAVSLLSLVSFTIVFLKTFFEKELYHFILAGKKPVSVALPVFVKTLFLGSWPFLIISLPFFFGLAYRSDGTFSSLLEVVLLHFLLSVILASLGALFAYLILSLVGKEIDKYFPVIVLGGLFFLFIVFTKFIFPENLSTISSQSDLLKVKSQLSSLPLNFIVFPTALFVNSFFKNYYSFVLLFLETVIFFTLLLLVVKKKYLALWKISFEGYLEAGAGGRPLSHLRLLSKSGLGAFYKKELLYFTREKGAFIYLSFIAFLISIFAFFLSQTGKFSGEYVLFEPIVKMAIFLTVSYLVLLVNIRFIFPTFSLEAPYLWPIATVPSIRKKVSSVKRRFYLFLALAFLILQVVLITFFSKVFIGPVFVVFLLLFSNTILVTATSLSLGQVSSGKIKETDADKISTTNQGILLTVFSLISAFLFSAFAFSPRAGFFSIFLLLLSLFFATVIFSYSDKIYQKNDL